MGVFEVNDDNEGSGGVVFIDGDIGGGVIDVEFLDFLVGGFRVGGREGKGEGGITSFT